MAPTRVIIDTDPGVDDAVALLFALRSPALDVLGLTTVAGNLKLDQTTRNALTVMENSGKSVPVYAGAPRPLREPLETAEHVHGSDGLGDVGFAPSTASPATTRAPEFIIDTAMRSHEPISLITLGPLTNVALALTEEPRIQQKIASIVMMIGAWTIGNITQLAEFNAGVDPEATDIVFSSSIPKVMVALDPIRDGALIDAADIARLEDEGTPWCCMAGALLSQSLKRWPRQKISLCDPAAVGVAIDRAVAKVEYLPVVAETRGDHTRGVTVVDFRRGRGHRLGVREPNMDVVTEIYPDRFRSLYMSTMLGR